MILIAHVFIDLVSKKTKISHLKILLYIKRDDIYILLTWVGFQATLRDIFIWPWYEIRGFLEKIPIFSYYQNCSRHFKIPHINFSDFGLNRANLR